MKAKDIVFGQHVKQPGTNDIVYILGTVYPGRAPKQWALVRNHKVIAPIGETADDAANYLRDHGYILANK